MSFIDKTVAMNYLMGNEAIFNKVKESFLKSNSNFQQKRDEFNASKNISDIHFYIHSIKGISLNIGAVQLFEVANRALEDIKKELWNQALIDCFFQTLNGTYEELKTL